MTTYTSWTQLVTADFFARRTTPTQEKCNETARSVSRAADVQVVQVPGSMSYTVICSGRPQGQQPLVVSFREPEAHLDAGIVALARQIHAELVPEMELWGMLDELAVYTMQLVPGVSCLNALSPVSEMDEAAEERHVRFVGDLARYFARSYSNPQSTSPTARSEAQDYLHRRLTALATASSSPFNTLAATLTPSLPALFASSYPQVLTHNDLSLTNLLVSPTSLSLTGIVDWSPASVRPFALDLDCLYLTTGCMSRAGWRDYACRPRLHAVFWAVFWEAAGVGEGERARVREMAETAARIGAVMRYAFKREADGSASEVVVDAGAATWGYLRGWFGDEEGEGK